jgi:hypothetical protein
MLRVTAYTILIFCIIINASCSQQEPSAALDKVPEPAAGEAIAVADVKTVLPQVGNADLIEMYCAPCHSLRYIEMQPELSFKAWEKIVDKMIHSYGAPVRDSIARRDIINYLYAIRGTSD